MVMTNGVGSQTELARTEQRLPAGVGFDPQASLKHNLVKWFLPVVPTSEGLVFNPRGLVGAGALAFGIYMLMKQRRRKSK